MSPEAWALACRTSALATRMLGKLQVISGPTLQEKPRDEVSWAPLLPAWATLPFRWTLGK